MLINIGTKYFKTPTAWKLFKYGYFCGPYFPVIGLNRGKHGPEKLRIWTLFMQWQTKTQVGT